MNPTMVKWLQAPSIILLLLWMIVPLSMTLYFSTIRYNLLYPERTGFIGLSNYEFFWTDPSFIPALINTLVLVGSVLIITVVLGLAVSLLVDKPFMGRGIARVMLISPFFIMPTVSALVWKNMLMDPNNGLFAAFSNFMGLTPVEWLQDYPLLSIIIMVLAVDAICNLDFHDVAAKPRPRAKRSCHLGWCRFLGSVCSSYAATSCTSDFNCDFDSDDFPSVHLR